MDYSKVAARLSYIARGLSWLLSGGITLPGFARAVDDADFEKKTLKSKEMIGLGKNKKRRDAEVIQAENRGRRQDGGGPAGRRLSGGGTAGGA
jgi:hypothetical protein